VVDSVEDSTCVVHVVVEKIELSVRQDVSQNVVDVVDEFVNVSQVVVDWVEDFTEVLLVVVVVPKLIVADCRAVDVVTIASYV
jgi:hypothetical protein